MFVLKSPGETELIQGKEDGPGSNARDEREERERTQSRGEKGKGLGNRDRSKDGRNGREM